MNRPSVIVYHLQKIRKKKNKGVIGRSSDDIIDFRQNICEQLIKTYTSTSKREFLILYKKALVNEGLTNLPTNQTLYKNINKLNYNFKKGIGFINLSEVSNDYQIMVNSLVKYIKQIRISWVV